MWPFKRTKFVVADAPVHAFGAKAAITDLAKTPGPAPWYLAHQHPISTPANCHWRAAGDQAPTAGKSYLVNDAGLVVAIADFHCYVRVIDRARFLVWFVDTESGAIRLACYETHQMRNLDNVSEWQSQLGPAKRWVSGATPTAEFDISTALSDGIHVLSLPQTFHDVGELLMLAPSTPPSGNDKITDVPRLRLWILDAATGRLEVVPQDWFNNGPYDFGYQWVTKMARVSASGTIVGEGVRLGVFSLDASHRAISAWLVADQFYHPERTTGPGAGEV